MNSNNPLVSIIIPVYNGSNYMRESIDSALSQTYKNIEIIVVNDGSNDNGKTRKIALSYGNKIRYFEKENGGVSTALNLALKEMNGEFFSWLSHDDRYYPNKIEKQIEYLNNCKEKNIILYSNYDLMNEYSEVYSKSVFNNYVLLNKPEYALLRGAINGITLLIPKSAFLEYGYFSEDLRCTQDYAKWAEFMNSYKFVHQDLILATSRVHSMQTGNTSPKMVTEGNQFWTNYVEGYNDNEKIRIDRTIFNYYYGFYNFIKLSPYIDTANFVKDKLNNIQKKYNYKDATLEIILDCSTVSTASDLLGYVKKLKKSSYKNFVITLVNFYDKKNIFDKDGRVKITKKSLFETINLCQADYICIINSFSNNLFGRFVEQIKFMELVDSKISYVGAKGQLISHNDFLINFHRNIIKIDSFILNNNYLKTNNIFIKDEFDSLFNFILDYDLLDIDFLDDALIEYSSDNVFSPNDFALCKNRLKKILESNYNQDYHLLKIFSEDLLNEINILDANSYSFNTHRSYINILRKKGLFYCLKKIYNKIIRGLK